MVIDPMWHRPTAMASAIRDLPERTHFAAAVLWPPLPLTVNMQALDWHQRYRQFVTVDLVEQFRTALVAASGHQRVRVTACNLSYHRGRRRNDRVAEVIAHLCREFDVRLVVLPDRTDGVVTAAVCARVLDRMHPDSALMLVDSDARRRIVRPHSDPRQQ